MPHTLRQVAVLIFGILSFAGAARAGSVLYGLTTTNLVIVNHNDPSQVTVVGPTGLSALGVAWTTQLTWHPGDGYLYGIGFDAPMGQPRNQHWLFRIDRLTGAASIVRAFGDPDEYKFEALEYVETLNSLVAAYGPNQDTSSLMTMTTGGVFTPLVNNGRDNDYGVFDSFFDVFFSVDPNGVGQLVKTDLGSGAATDLGSVPVNLSDMAYNPDDHYIYGADSPSGGPRPWYRIWTTNGGAPAYYEVIDTVAGDQWMSGLAFAPPIPEPATWLTCGGALAILVLRRRRRR
jgi:hypothetical protein